ncbi:MAG: hypothetical protein KatS3mg022_0681 [Armatimonadota bacterium]|nr:MAG: hypothetical protein KatS3mg022_0681 [Armatimonadota bacterium]
MSWWGCFWVRILTWFLAVEQPSVHGGNLAVPSPAVAVVPVRRGNLSVYLPRPLHCRVVGVSARAQRCAVRHLSPPRTQVRMVCAPSAIARVQAVPLAIRIRSCKLVPMRATLPVPRRVLLYRYQPAIRARVRLLPKQVRTVSAGLQWRCRTQQVTVERFRCRSVYSSLAWQLPIARRALCFEHLAAEHRRQCRDALQRAAKGYARVQSVYYPVPAHAVARLEIDERVGVLYVHPRKGRSDVVPACLWVVSGVQLVDGRAVRAVLRMI